MAPNQQYRTLFSGPMIFAKPLPNPINIKVEYCNKSKEVIKDNFVIDTGEYWGTAYFQSKGIEDMNRSLLEISKSISNLQKKL